MRGLVIEGHRLYSAFISRPWITCSLSRSSLPLAEGKILSLFLFIVFLSRRCQAVLCQAALDSRDEAAESPTEAGGMMVNYDTLPNAVIPILKFFGMSFTPDEEYHALQVTCESPRWAREWFKEAFEVLPVCMMRTV